MEKVLESQHKTASSSAKERATTEDKGKRAAMEVPRIFKLWVGGRTLQVSGIPFTRCSRSHMPDLLENIAQSGRQQQSCVARAASISDV